MKDGMLVPVETPVLLGKLLVQSGMLDERTWAAALERSLDSGQKIGVLLNGFVSDRCMKAALRAQRMIRQSLITFRQAVEALTLVRQKRNADRLEYLNTNWLSKFSQLAKCLLDLGLLKQDYLAKSIITCIDSNQTLGELLQSRGKLTFELRKAAIYTMIQSRCGKITPAHAQIAMKAVLRTGKDIRNLIDFESCPIAKLSEDLVYWGILSEMEVLDITERTLQSLGQEHLIEITLSTDLNFNASERLKQRLKEGALTAEQAKLICHKLKLSADYVLGSATAFTTTETILVA